MHCTNCDYPLWNIGARQCPECGTAFRPSEFEFIINSVQFRCPHCEQAYFGTGPLGHLVPVEYDCVSCGTHIHMDEMILAPAEGVTEAQTEPDRQPWLHRAEIGRVRAWFRMLGMALVHPVRLMRATPVGSSTGQAWWFGIVTALMVMLAAFIPAVCLLAFPFAAAGAPGGGTGGAPTGLTMLAAMSAGIGMMFVFGFGFWLLMTAMWGLATHAILLVGLKGGLPAGIGRTYQALCYSSGTNIVTAVPCIGGLGYIWWLISATLAMREAHKVSAVRASVATLIPPLVIFGVAVGGYVGFTYYMMSMIGTTGGIVVTSQETSFVADRLVERWDADGAWPRHGIQLVDEEWGVENFVVMDTATFTEDVPIGDMSLDELAMLPTNRRRMAQDEIAASLPDDVVAHRIGDFVFTYHGIDPGTASPDLWVLVVTPDPDQNVPNLGDDRIAATLDGRTIELIFTGDDALEVQNALRAEHGLAPLPPFDEITNAEPVRAGADGE